MDDGTTDGPSTRGRSRESRPRQKDKNKEEGDRRGSNKGKTEVEGQSGIQKDTVKKPRRGKKSKSPYRSKSGNSSESTTARKRSVSRGKEKTSVDASREMELSGEKGQLLKQEIIDSTDKVQTTLSFPLMNETSALNPCVIHDEEDAQTRETNLSSSSRGTPKRKQKEMTKGITKEPDGVAKRTAFNHGIYRRHEDTTSGGRGRG